MRKTINLLTLLCFILLSQSIFSQQGVAINTDGSSAHQSAMLHVKANNKGMLIPNLILDDASTAAPVSNPETGLLIYNGGGIEPKGFYYWEGSRWQPILSGKLTNLSDLDGDTKIEVDNGSDYDEIIFTTNGSEVFRIKNNGKIGVGTQVPIFDLEISSQAEDESSIIVLRNPSFNQNLLFQSGDNNTLPLISFKGNDALRLGYFDGLLHELMRIQNNGDIAIEGSLRIKSSSEEAPLRGTIRWSEGTNDFEGYNGNFWISMTGNSSWGNRELSAYEDQFLIGGDSENDFTGSSVFISDDLAIVGIPGDNQDRGKVVIYRKSGSSWIHETGLSVSNGKTGDKFGISVSISGNHAIVGAPFRDAGGNINQGTVYFYHHNGTNWVEKDTVSLGGANANCGLSVGISGDDAIIGIPGLAQVALIYSFNGTQWSLDQGLSSLNVTGGQFGKSVSISGDYVIIGAPEASYIRPYTGAAVIFHRTGSSWSEQQVLFDTSGINGDNFGFSVSISDDIAIVGAPNCNVNFNDQGKSFVFSRNASTWAQEEELISSDGWVNSRFGSSVSTFGQYCVVGAPYQMVQGNFRHGKAYVYQKINLQWSEQATLLVSNGTVDDYFGSSVSVSGDHIIVGASHYDWAQIENFGIACIYNKN